MFDLDRWNEIINTITHNKSRSFLTAFGVFWGMLMLVLMVGAGRALEQGLMSQIGGFATNSCFFMPDNTSLPYKGFQKGRNWQMKNSDISIIQNKVDGIEYLSPLLFMFSSKEKNVFYNEKGGAFFIKGCYPEYNNIERSDMIYGRYINDIDIREKRKSCIIGERVYEVLFKKGENPVGKQIKVNGIYFNVIGVSSKTSKATVGGDPEETIIVPFSTMQQAYNMGNNIDMLAATAKPNISVKSIQEKVEEILKQQHQISPDDKEAVFAINIEEQFKMFQYLKLGVGSFIWIVGLGTLLGGAIGVSNIMLVTVRERTKEIGIRRALGATPRNIIGQILSESVVLTVLAGIGGIVIGVGILSAVGVALSQSDQFIKDPQISFYVSIVALIILIVVGALAGFLPAQRAMMIKPIEAIREE